MPTVQAIIPAYNPDPDHLRQAIESCLPEPAILGVLVIDDGSEPAVRITTDDPRVRLVRQANAGPSTARNLGLDGLAADHAMLLDHDDVLEPAVLGRALALCSRLGAAAVVSARYELRDGNRTLKEVPPPWRDAVLPCPGEVFRPLALFGASGVLVSAAAVRGGVRFDPGLMIGEDRDFLRRVAEHGPIAVNACPLLTVRLHSADAGNLSSPAHLARRARDHLAILERHHDSGSDGPLREQTLWLMNQLSKQRGTDPKLWASLSDAARRYGWPTPLKSRIRAALRGLSHA